MNTQEIVEGNKLIAEFMGAKLIVSKGYYKLDHSHYYPEQLFYHTSWGWLMLVVEKIEKIYDEDGDNWLGQILDNDFPDIFDLNITESIETVHAHVIQFIQWYNSTNQNK